MSDLRSQLIAKLGVEAPAVGDTAPVKADPLSVGAHLNSDWVRALTPAVATAGIKLNSDPSLGAVRQAHDVLVKRLKANGDKRTVRLLGDLRKRYEGKREKLAWARLKAALDEAGVSPKLYRAIKSSQCAPEVVLARWGRVANKGLNKADLRAALLSS
jgi:hypothetical protein